MNILLFLSLILIIILYLYISKKVKQGQIQQIFLVDLVLLFVLCFSVFLQSILTEKLNINPKNVHAYVIGEHGDSEFVPWSNVNIGLQNINDYLTHEQEEIIENNVRNAAYEIINRKGATYYGIGMCLVRITNAILGDENSVITVSAYDENNDIYMAVPCVLNKNGIERKIYVKLNEEETNKLQNCVNTIKDAIKKIEN